MHHTVRILPLLIIWSGLMLMGAETTADPLSREWTAPTMPKVHIVALGHGAYRAHVFTIVDQRAAPIAVLNGTMTDGAVSFVAAPLDDLPQGDAKQHPAWWPAPSTSTGWSGRYADGVLTLTKPQGQPEALVPHQVGVPTVGLPPPASAVVLIDSKSTEESIRADWIKAGTSEPTKWRVLPGGIVECVPKSGSMISRRTFGNHRLHVEFCLPFEPDHRGQNRANSGVYIQGRYEVQVLDSFGLQGVDNECGGFYKIAKPIINACAPPLTWQTYDIDFTAATFAGTVQTKPARVTVHHNGILIHQDQELNTATAYPLNKAGPTPEGVYLQEHGHPVQFRNVWILPVPSAQP